MLFSLASISLASISLSIIFAESPLTLGLWLILITLISSVFILSTTSKWFGIVLFLVYVGGLLVIFSYFSAISPNQLTDISVIGRTLFSSLFLIGGPVILTQTPSFLGSWIKLPVHSQHLVLSSSNMIILVSAAVVLFLTMIMVIKVAPNHQGPLRPFS